MPIYSTTYPPKKGKDASLEEVPAINDFVDREFSTLFIVKRAGNTYETQRIQRDKVGKKIDTALRNGKLWSENGMFRFGDLIAWLRTKKGLAKAADGFLAIGHATADLTLPSPQLSAFVYSLPVTLEDCHEALREALRDLNNVREENLRLHAQVDALLPFRAKVQKQSLDGHLNGEQGGRGNKK